MPRRFAPMWLVHAFATFIYTGCVSFAPATFATAVFLGCYALIPGGERLAHPLVCLLTALLAVPAAGAVEKARGKDPRCVVIDEVVGIQLVLVGSYPTPAGLAAAFVLFRVFDVWKPFPIHRLQSWPGGWGIVADDALAGVYARAVMAALTLATASLGRFAF